MTKLENSNCDKKSKSKSKSNSDKTKKKIIVTNPENEIVTVVIMTVVTVTVLTVVIVTSFSKKNLTPYQPMRCSRGHLFAILAMFFFLLPSSLTQLKSIHSIS